MSPANPLLKRLRDALLDHLNGDPRQRPLGGLGLFHSRSAQTLRAVPLRQPAVVLIVSGHKEVMLGARSKTVRAGELLLVPGNTTIELANHPDPHNHTYLSLALAFGDGPLEQFRRQYAAPLKVWENPPRWRGAAPESFIGAMEQWLSWCRARPLDPLVVQHRQVEFLLLLAQAGLAGHLLLGHRPDWRQRVTQLLALDPAHPWQAGAVCGRLGVGESTLRRLLAEEGSSFRELLEETRLVAGLALLQETFWPVGQVAETVGYHSASRFSERFKRRFGLTPSELKKTRASDSGGNRSE